MAHTINITTTGNALGQYCVKFGDQINQTVRTGLELEGALPKIDCDYAYQGQDVTVSDIIQPYQKAFTPNNTESFDGVLNILQIGKIDLEFDWEQMETFFDKWRCNWFEAGMDEDEWSYPRYIIDEVILPKIIEELNTLSYQGVYAAPTPGTAGALLTTFTGFKKKIEDFITAGDLTPLVVGALVDSTFVAQTRAACAGLPIKYRHKKGKILMSKTNAQRYADDYQTKYPARKVTIEMQDKQYLRVDHYNKVIEGVESMEGSDRFIFIFDGLDSMLIGSKKGRPMIPELRFHVYDRSLHVLGEFHRFFGFETLQHIFVSDQA
jgi:hypothetical protein